MTANYHTHTPRCNHAIGEEREYIERAISCDFKILGFSDHTPQPYPATYHSGMRMAMSEIEDYVGTLSRLRDEYRDEIQILIGFEAEYSPKYFAPLISALQNYPVDYIIQGQHFVADEITGFYAGEQTWSEQRLSDYAELTVEGMKTGLFSYLAHPDLLNFLGEDSIFEKHMQKIVETSIALDIPLEVNMLGFETHRHYPSRRFFKMASKMGAQFVIGCDAHTPEAIRLPSDNLSFQAFLDECGISVGSNIINLRSISGAKILAKTEERDENQKSYALNLFRHSSR